MHMLIVPRGHAVRPAAERLIAEIFARSYSARVETFPEMLVTMTDGGGNPVCAAALRFAKDGFFSECYLDSPIQIVLQKQTLAAPRRDKIFEVTSLASCTPQAAGAFLQAIFALGERNGFDWAFFTATDALKGLLERIQLPLLYLASADRSRVSNPLAWGSYYERRPRVYAVNRAGASQCFAKHSLVGADG